MIKAFKFRAQPIFSLLEATHSSGSQNSVETNFNFTCGQQTDGKDSVRPNV